MYTVTMRNTVVSETDSGTLKQEFKAVDHVPDEMLDDYVADAKTRWSEVIVEKEN